MNTEELLAILANPETPEGVISDAIQETNPTPAVYVVQGCSFEVDSMFWNCAAFLHKERAIKYLQELKSYCIDLKIWHDQWPYNDSNIWIFHDEEKLKQFFNTSHSGTPYTKVLRPPMDPKFPLFVVLGPLQYSMIEIHLRG